MQFFRHDKDLRTEQAQSQEVCCGQTAAEGFEGAHGPGP
jgi:hypothetical protein